MANFSDLLNNARNTTLVKNLQKWPQFIGQYGWGEAADAFGTGIRAPEFNVSEVLAGGDTMNTQNYQRGEVYGNQIPYNNYVNLVNPETGERLGQKNRDETGGTGGDTGGTGDGTVTNPTPAGTPDFESVLRGARDEARRQAEAGYNRARGIYDEGMGILNKRRGEFQDLFEQGRENILGRYEQERGNLQESAQGARTRMANALRALGLGGSAFVKSEGRQRQNEARGLGNLAGERETNERANQAELSGRIDWANTQEGALQRALEDAGNVRSGIESSADINYLNDVSGMLNRILENQMALNAASGNFTANPYQVNISDLTGALNAALPSLSGGSGTVQNVSLREQDPLLATLYQDPRKRSGVAGGGLYA